jgi:hypothetical protein
LARAWLGQQAEGLGKDRHGPPFIRIGQDGAHKPACTQMVMMLAVGVETGFKRSSCASCGSATLKAAQARCGRKLRKDQGHEMIPALEPFVIGVACVPADDGVELPPVNGCQQLAKNAKGKAHASPFLF